MSDSREQARRQQALNYHSQGRPGKSEVIPTKPCLTSRDLSMAYSPGVAYPCLEIEKDPDSAYQYTNKGNLVGVISNGSAVLGLGNIGALAGKPVMEGKGVLFKRFADIDVFDVELNANTVEEMVSVIEKLEPTFGGINLEDIKAPECFEVERQLKEKMKIPVFHDDQHGTAIICAAAFVNALQVAKKKIEKVKIVFSGAGAASLSCAQLFLKLGVPKKNILICDSKGVIYQGRTEGMNQYKEEFANETALRTMEEALKGADAFIGCSFKGVVSPQMVASMAKNPIIFAMANPDPEITPEEVAQVRNDAIMATGRSDYPNQVNNVLGFPFIFRGALDVRAHCINEEMKLAAVYALANLAKEIVPEEVQQAYGGSDFCFGRDYLIPKPFDKRILTTVAPAVAKAAVESGASSYKDFDWQRYPEILESRLGQGASFMRSIRSRLPRKERSKILFTEATNAKILHAISIVNDEKMIEAQLIGNCKEIQQKMTTLGLEHLLNLDIIEPMKSPYYQDYVQSFMDLRQRKGVTSALAKEAMLRSNYFGAMMVKKGQADGLVTGIDSTYAEAFKPIMRVVGESQSNLASGVMVLIFKSKILFLADCTAQTDPGEKELVQIAENTIQLYQQLMQSAPRVAFLSYSCFGSNRTASSSKMSRAANLLRERHSDLQIDGELQADVAVNENLLKSLYPFNQLQGPADVLIFPDLNSANIAYKLLIQLGGATPIGPILTPLDYPINIIQRTATVSEVVNMTLLTAMVAQRKKGATHD